MNIKIRFTIGLLLSAVMVSQAQEHRNHKADSLAFRAEQYEADNNFEQAKELYLQAAKLGHAIAMLNLGTLYMEEQKPESYAEAMH